MASFVSPYEESRQEIGNMVENNIIVYIKTDIEICKARDFEGKYKKALDGEYKNFTGVSDIYEEPKGADIIIDTDTMSPDAAAKIIIEFVKKKYRRASYK